MRQREYWRAPQRCVHLYGCAQGAQITPQFLFCTFIHFSKNNIILHDALWEQFTESLQGTVHARDLQTRLYAVFVWKADKSTHFENACMHLRFVSHANEFYQSQHEWRGREKRTERKRRLLCTSAHSVATKWLLPCTWICCTSILINLGARSGLVIAIQTAQVCTWIDNNMALWAAATTFLKLAVFFALQ